MSKVSKHNKNGEVLTYRFNKKLMAEIESLKSDFLERNKVGKDTYRLFQLIMQKQYAFERGKSISRGRAIAKARRLTTEEQLITAGV